MELMETMELMEGLSPVEAGKKERDREVYKTFLEKRATSGRTQAYYETAAERKLSYVTVVGIVKRMEEESARKGGEA